MNNLAQVIKQGKLFLKKTGIESWSLDAELLFMGCCAGLTRVQLITDGNRPVSDSTCRDYEKFLARRAAGEPVQYILNRCEFMSLEFYVDDSVLIPRPDTETLVEAAIDRIKTRGYKSVLEIGTGSGCISVALAYYLENLRITACDISERALGIAGCNAEKNGVADKIEFLHKNCLTSLGPPETTYDVILSNPPYIPTGTIKTLEDNVKKFEPALALDGGVDGLDFYRVIARDFRKFLNPGGTLICEIGYDQGPRVKNLMETGCFRIIAKTKIICDLSGHDRVIIVDVD